MGTEMTTAMKKETCKANNGQRKEKRRRHRTLEHYQHPVKRKNQRMNQKDTMLRQQVFQKYVGKEKENF